MVGAGGLEPPRRKPLDFEPSVSTNSTTPPSVRANPLLRGQVSRNLFRAENNTTASNWCRLKTAADSREQDAVTIEADSEGIKASTNGHRGA